MNFKSQNQYDCFDPHSGLIPLAVAEQSIQQAVSPIQDTEVVSLSNSVGRVLAGTVTSRIDVPPHANSAMDGFAIAASSLPETGSRSYRVAGTALAGKPWPGPCAENEVVRVMTGAVMPLGTDTVIIQEDVQAADEKAEIRSGHRPYQNVRPAGEDLKSNEPALKSGIRIGAAEMGVLASTGVGEVEVIRKPAAAVFSTGDELMNAGEPLPPGAIYDSNRYVLIGLLQSTGMDVRNLGIIPDNQLQTIKSLRKASEDADVIITSGGVSTGSADYVINALAELGELNLWRIALRPGRPFAFGRIGRAYFFGLPGNPVAVMVTFYRLVQPALRKLMGTSEHYPVQVVKARAVTKFKKKPNRSEIYRAVLSHDENENPIVSSTGFQGSGLLSSMSHANCFVLLGDDDVAVNPGDMVNVQLFCGLTGN